jgi:hypothetical protein
MESAFLCFSNALVWPPIPRRNDFSGNPLEVQNNVLRRLILCDDDGYYIIDTGLTAHC